MEGVIVGFSDSGPVNRAFAVIKLDGDETIVVAVDKLVSVGRKQPKLGS